MTKAEELYRLGQSVWLDNINRRLILSGGLERMIETGLSGLTSNPSIFEKAISAGADYDPLITELNRRGSSAFEIYDELTLADVRDAADAFLEVFRRRQGRDGFVSLEINPKLAHDVEETVKEGKRLFGRLNRPNCMLKVPATESGFKAIEELVSYGVNVNVTLIFSLAQYIGAAEAYIKGINRFIKNKGDAGRVHSVASVFVSRLDTAVDSLLEGLGKPHLKGRAATSNCALIYKKSLEIFSSSSFKSLKDRGVNPQRVLWASTSTKNPDYSDTKYVTELIARDTVNTLPEPTFQAFLDHGKVKEALTGEVSWAESHIAALSEAGIDINQECVRLQQEGIAAFEKAFDLILSTVETKIRSSAEVGS